MVRSDIERVHQPVPPVADPFDRVVNDSPSLMVEYERTLSECALTRSATPFLMREHRGVVLIVSIIHGASRVTVEPCAVRRPSQEIDREFRHRMSLND